MEERNEALEHSFKGTEWKEHKYLKKIDGKYIYPKSYDVTKYNRKYKVNKKLAEHRNRETKVTGSWKPDDPKNRPDYLEKYSKAKKEYNAYPGNLKYYTAIASRTEKNKARKRYRTYGIDPNKKHFTWNELWTESKNSNGNAKRSLFPKTYKAKKEKKVSEKKSFRERLINVWNAIKPSSVKKKVSSLKQSAKSKIIRTWNNIKPSTQVLRITDRAAQKIHQREHEEKKKKILGTEAQRQDKLKAARKDIGKRVKKKETDEKVRKQKQQKLNKTVRTLYRETGIKVDPNNNIDVVLRGSYYNTIKNRFRRGRKHSGGGS